MHVGILRAQQAARASTHESIQDHQVQLTQFIQNLQHLLTTTTTGFWSRSLSVSIDQDKSLSIFLLSYTTAKAKTLLLDFFEAIELSPDSTKGAIQNKVLNTQLEDLNQKVMVLTAEYDALTKKKSKPATQSQSTASIFNSDDEEDDDFVCISLAVVDGKKLSQGIEYAWKRRYVLENLITVHSGRSNVGVKSPNNDADVGYATGTTPS